MFTSATFILLSLLAASTSVSASPIKRANNQLIVSTRDNKCLSPAGGAAAVTTGQVGNGTPLVTLDCAQAAGWDISPGSGSVVLTGTNYAMDAGSAPGNNGQLKVCPSGLERSKRSEVVSDGFRLKNRLGLLTQV